MTSYIESFVGDENPVDIEVAIVECCIHDILKSCIGKSITSEDVKVKLREFAEDYWRLYPTPSGYVVIKGVIDIES